MKNYLSVVYDLTNFGIFKIRNAIVNSDMDDDISIDVSFDGGVSFTKVELNTKFGVKKSIGKIQVRITFEDISSVDIYKIKASGYFQNLDVGTTVNFTKQSTNKTYKTNIGRNGQFNVSLPRGLYNVWYINNGEKENLMLTYNPEIVSQPTQRLDKEALIEATFRDIGWAKYSVFDTFVDKKKMANGSAIVDTDGDLSDGATNRKCRWWSIGFD